jgi:CRISPR/Cas system type I-B associated protein Csh2 (Cas7 group RAMP superfamily)
MNAKEKQTMLDSNVPRITGLLVIEVRDSNPNGDPDNAGFPRQRPDDRGEISPVSVKRKLRELVSDKEGLIWQEMKRRLSLGDNERFDILETRGRVRSEIFKKLADGRFQQDYWDARLFGCTFLESKEAVDEEIKKLEKESKTTLTDKQRKEILDKSIRAGTAHFGVGVSVAPVRVRFETWTNKPGVQEGKDRGFAPQALKYVEHGIYTVPFFVNPTQARKTGCTGDDVRLMLHLLKHAYRDNPSTVRTQVELIHAHAVEHKDVLGSFSDFALLDALKPIRLSKDDAEKQPSTSRADYQIPTWDEIKGNAVRKQGEKSLTWDDVGIHTDYALL